MQLLHAIPKFEACLNLILEARTVKLYLPNSLSAHIPHVIWLPQANTHRRYLELKMGWRTCFYCSFWKWELEKHLVFSGSSNTILVFGPSPLCSCWEVFILEAKLVCPRVNSCGWGSWCLGCGWTLSWSQYLDSDFFDCPTFNFWQIFVPLAGQSKKLFLVSFLEAQPRACSPGPFSSFTKHLIPCIKSFSLSKWTRLVSISPWLIKLRCLLQD